MNDKTETEHLLKSEANADRLKKSIEAVEKGDVIEADIGRGLTQPYIELIYAPTLDDLSLMRTSCSLYGDVWLYERTVSCLSNRKKSTIQNEHTQAMAARCERWPHEMWRMRSDVISLDDSSASLLSKVNTILDRYNGEQLLESLSSTKSMTIYSCKGFRLIPCQYVRELRATYVHAHKGKPRRKQRPHRFRSIDEAFELINSI